MRAWYKLMEPHKISVISQKTRNKQAISKPLNDLAAEYQAHATTADA